MAMKMMIQNTYTHWLWWNKIPVVDKSRHPISYYHIQLGFFNRSMQAYFEQWLRFMLRWDPKARGGGLCDGRPQCFKVLDTVLSIKVNRNWSILNAIFLQYISHMNKYFKCTYSAWKFTVVMTSKIYYIMLIYEFYRCVLNTMKGKDCFGYFYPIFL